VASKTILHAVWLEGGGDEAACRFSALVEYTGASGAATTRMVWSRALGQKG
jgi:hypothetical protein